MAQTGECTRSLELEIPAGEIERESSRIAQGLQRRVRIPGFRPGKAPIHLVRQHFGDKIREETLDTLIPAHLRAAFERESLDPVSTPTLDPLDFKPGEPLKFKASFEVMPTFELGDYRSIRAEKPEVNVTPAEVDAALDALRERKATHPEASPDVVELADGLVAAVTARVLPDDAAATAEGAAAVPTPPAPPQDLDIEIGGRDTLAAFSDGLRGMKIGQEREIEVAYPADYPSPEMVGKTRRYHLALKGIKLKQMPELTDEFVKQETGTENVTELRQRVEENLRHEREHAARHQAEDKILEQLLTQSEFPVPEALVDKQVDAKLERNLRSLADQGVDPRKLKVDWSKLRARQEPAARREVRVSLILDAIARKEQIEATPEAIESEIKHAAEGMGQPAEALRARLNENGGLKNLQNRIRTERVLEFLISNATQSAARGEKA